MSSSAEKTTVVGSPKMSPVPPTSAEGRREKGETRPSSRHLQRRWRGAKNTPGDPNKPSKLLVIAPRKLALDGARKKLLLLSSVVWAHFRRFRPPPHGQRAAESSCLSAPIKPAPRQLLPCGKKQMLLGLLERVLSPSPLRLHVGVRRARLAQVHAICSARRWRGPKNALGDPSKPSKLLVIAPKKLMQTKLRGVKLRGLFCSGRAPPAVAESGLHSST